MLQPYLQIGVITSTHALRGEVKVYPTTDDVRRFEDLTEVYAASDPEHAGEALFVESVRYFKNMVILKFRGLDRIEDVQILLRKNLYVARKDAVPLGENQYYVADLYGMEVVREEDGTTLGKITDVLVTGANDVYVVKEQQDPKKEILIPAIRDCIRKVDLEGGTMTVHLPDGLV